MKITRNIGITLCFTLALLIVGGWGIGLKYQEVRKQALQKENVSPDAPHLEWMHTSFDWGTIGRTQKMNHHFPIRNTGQKPLVISQIQTSCNCTTAEILKEDVPQTLPATLEPGEKAIVSVSFDPEVMDSRGLAKRAVRMETNDPALPFLIFNLQAYVE